MSLFTLKCKSFRSPFGSLVIESREDEESVAISFQGEKGKALSISFKNEELKTLPALMFGLEVTHLSPEEEKVKQKLIEFWAPVMDLIASRVHDRSLIPDYFDIYREIHLLVS